MTCSPTTRTNLYKLSGVALVCVLLGLLAEIRAADAGAQRVIGYRNDFTGVYLDATPPLTWKATTNESENVLWHMPLPGPAEIAQPIIVGDRIIVMSQPFYLSCFDKMTGKLLWERRTHGREDSQNEDERKAFLLERYVNYMMDEVIARYGCTDPCRYGRPLTRSERYVASIEHIRLTKANLGDAQRAKLTAEFDAIMARAPATWEGCNVFDVAIPNRDGDLSYTALATPASDGKFIYAHFATGVAVCYDLNGRLQWLRLFLEEDGKTISSSPIGAGGYNHATPFVLDGRLYLPRSGKDPKKGSWGMVVYCLDAASGSTVWNNFIGKMTQVGLAPVVRNGLTWIASVSGTIFKTDGTTVYGTYFSVGNGGNCGPFFALDRETGTLYHGARGVRLPDQADAFPDHLWKLPHYHGAFPDKWPDQLVPPGERPLPMSRLEEVKKLQGLGNRGDFRGSIRNHAAGVAHRGILYNFYSASKTLSAADVSQDNLENMLFSEPLPHVVPDVTVKASGRGQEYTLHRPQLYADLSIAGDYLYVQGYDRTAVLRTGKEFEMLAVNQHEPTIGNLVFDGDRIYLRGLDHLYCLGGPNATERIPSLKPGTPPPAKADYPVLADRMTQELLPRLLPILWKLDAAETVKVLEKKFEDRRDRENMFLLAGVTRIDGDRSALLPLLTTALKTAAYPWYKILAMHILENMGPSAAPAIPAVMAVVGEEHEYVRRYAARALGAIGPAAAEAIPSLEKLLPDPAPAEETPLIKEVKQALEKIRGEKK